MSAAGLRGQGSEVRGPSVSRVPRNPLSTVHHSEVSNVTACRRGDAKESSPGILGGDRSRTHSPGTVTTRSTKYSAQTGAGGGVARAAPWLPGLHHV